MAQPSQPSAAVLSALIEAGVGIMQTKYASLATFALIIYDHLLTLDMEIEHMWKRNFSVVTALFYLTRYYFLLAFAVTLFLFVIPVFGISSCERALLFLPLGAGVPFTLFPNCIIALRIYALYGRNNKLALAMAVYLAAQQGVGLWVDLTPTLTRIDVFAALGYPALGEIPAMLFCDGAPSTKLTGVQKSSYQIMQSIFDTVALALILINARKKSDSGLITLIAKQGLAYYILNAAIYIPWALMLVFAPPSSTYVLGGPALGLTCIAVNRLTLHLRSYIVDVNTFSGDSGRTMEPFEGFNPNLRRRNSWLGASTLDIHESQHDTIMSSDGGSTLEMYNLPGDGDGGVDHKVRI